MLTSTDKTNIFLWTDQFLANAVKCMNEYVCCGKSGCELKSHIAKVVVLKQNITNATSYLTVEQIDNLYRRLQCLINLKIQDSKS